LPTAAHEAPDLTRLFRRAPCFVGAGLFAAGVGSLAYLVASGSTPSWVALGAASAAALLGTGLVCLSQREACSACHDELVETHATLSLEVQEQVRVAVLAAKTGDLDWVLLLQGLPLAPRHARRTATLELSYCPTCRLVGKLSSGQRWRAPDGSMVVHEVSPPVVLSGPSLASVLEVISVRNMARTRALYGNSQ